MNKKAAVIVGIVIVALVGFLVWQNQSMKQTPTPEVVETTPTNNPNVSVTTEPVTGTAETKKAGFTMAEVATHNSATSCYVVVGTGVYNLTDWVAKHPGGPEAIKGLCGIDGTEKFTKQHGTFQKAKDTLASYMIGDLIQ